jgi:hypothetical protein
VKSSTDYAGPNSLTIKFYLIVILMLCFTILFVEAWPPDYAGPNSLTIKLSADFITKSEVAAFAAFPFLLNLNLREKKMVLAKSEFISPRARKGEHCLLDTSQICHQIIWKAHRSRGKISSYKMLVILPCEMKSKTGSIQELLLLLT